MRKIARRDVLEDVMVCSCTAHERLPKNETGLSSWWKEQETSNTRHQHGGIRSRGHNMGITVFQSSGHRRLDEVDSL